VMGREGGKAGSREVTAARLGGRWWALWVAAVSGLEQDPTR
jgi:hypothetical protein